MTAYIIAIRRGTRDADELAAYSRMAAAARRPGMKAIAAYGKFEVLEGPDAEGVVLLQFDSMKEARAWYDSQAYQDARAHRLAGADYDFILFEGL